MALLLGAHAAPAQSPSRESLSRAPLPHGAASAQSTSAAGQPTAMPALGSSSPDLLWNRTDPVAVVSGLPAYPEGARSQGIEGDVGLAYMVDVDGTVAAAAVTKRSGSLELDRAAEAAVRTWRFRPGTRDGQPVLSVGETTIRFRLQDGAGAGRQPDAAAPPG